MNKRPLQKKANIEECIHYWVIEPPSGPNGSPGACRRCGDIRTFQNAWVEAYGSWRRRGA